MLYRFSRLSVTLSTLSTIGIGMRADADSMVSDANTRRHRCRKEKEMTHAQRTFLIIASGVAATILVGACLAGCKSQGVPLEVVAKLDLNKYLGTWYEIARYPNRFERDCVGVTATYSLREDGKIRVLNAARLRTLDGPVKTAEGRAWMPDAQTPAKLRVSFFGPFAADYWVIALGEQYEYAIISEPSRRYLWILCRTPQMADDRYHELLQWLTGQGFDHTKLERTLQPSAMPPAP